jgi:hypothetical protein
LLQIIIDKLADKTLSTAVTFKELLHRKAFFSFPSIRFSAF